MLSIFLLIRGYADIIKIQSVSQTLHTSTPTLLAPLFSHHINAARADGERENTHVLTLIRRVLTALIHHVKGAEEFVVVGDLVVGIFAEAASALSVESTNTTPEGNEGEGQINRERLKRSMEVLFIVCSVRHGSRMTRKFPFMARTPSKTSLTRVFREAFGDSREHFDVTSPRSAPRLENRDRDGTNHDQIDNLGSICWRHRPDSRA